MSEEIKKIELNWKNLNVATLALKQQKFYYKINRKNLVEAFYDNCPIEFVYDERIYKDEFVEVDSIPIIFGDYFVSRERKDIRDSLGITPEDSGFEVLYKVAKNSDFFDHDGFWLSESYLEKEKKYIIKD